MFLVDINYFIQIQLLSQINKIVRVQILLLIEINNNSPNWGFCKAEKFWTFLQSFIVYFQNSLSFSETFCGDIMQIMSQDSFILSKNKPCVHKCIAAARRSYSGESLGLVKNFALAWLLKNAIGMTPVTWSLCVRGFRSDACLMRTRKPAVIKQHFIIGACLRKYNDHAWQLRS